MKKDINKIDVQLHNFITYQTSYNSRVGKEIDVMTRNMHMVYELLFKPEIEKRQKDRVCVSAIK